MKWLDQKGRLFGKIHFFDLLILVLLVAGLALMGLRLLKMEPKEEQFVPQKTVTGQYIVELRGAKDYQVDGFNIGDQLYENFQLMGTVVDKKVQPSKADYLKPDGTAAQAEHQLLFDVFLTIETDQLSVDGVYHIGTQEALNGTHHTFYNEMMQYTGLIRSVKVK